MTLNRTHTTCVVEDVRRGVEGIEQKPPARTEEDRDVTEEEYTRRSEVKLSGTFASCKKKSGAGGVSKPPSDHTKRSNKVRSGLKMTASHGAGVRGAHGSSMKLLSGYGQNSGRVLNVSQKSLDGK